MGDKLEADQIAKFEKPGLYGDGDGLWLQVRKTKAGGLSRSWIFRYRMGAKSRYMGLGKFPIVGLRQARAKAKVAAVALIGDGVEPRVDLLAVKRAKAAQEAEATRKLVTFKKAAEDYIKAHEGTWKNKAHAAQWPATLKAYVYPVFGDLSVAAVDTGLVLKAIEPIWNEKPETASRVRGRIETVLDWAKTRELRSGDNPARWRGHLDKTLPAKTKVRKVKPQPALPYAQIGAFMEALDAKEGMSALALKTAILTATRSGEITGARWTEVDLGAGEWLIPEGRMKAAKAHKVPLSAPVLAILRPLYEARLDDDAYVFSGGKAGKPLSAGAMEMLIKGMNEGEGGPTWVDPRQEDRPVTPHGFRSTFRDWAAERTSYASDVVEMALAHAISSKVEAAYRRGDLFDKRKRLMADWAAFCAQPSPAKAVDNVHAIGGR